MHQIKAHLLLFLNIWKTQFMFSATCDWFCTDGSHMCESIMFWYKYIGLHGKIHFIHWKCQFVMTVFIPPWQHCVGHVINSALQCHHENYHCCTKSLLVMTALWLREMDCLLQQVRYFKTVYSWVPNIVINVPVRVFISRKMSPYTGVIWHYTFIKKKISLNVWVCTYWPDSFLEKQSIHPI